MSRAVVYVASFSLILLVLPVPTSAQFNVGLGADVTLSLSPAHPTPGGSVKITALSTSVDLSGANLRWFKNQKEIAEGMGLSEIDIVAGPLGSETSVRVEIAENDIEVASAEARVRPTEVDLLWESDSYVPPFFRGRSLPSAGTNLRLEAAARFKKDDGSLVPGRDIVFTWRKNGYVVKSASGRGKDRVLLPSPPLFGSDTVSVEARTSDGLFEGVASARIPATEPHLSLYEDHPLFGILYHQALGATARLPEVEASFAAVPYYAEARSPNGGELIYEWRVNGHAITSDASRPNKITIDSRGSSGIARVELALTHVTNFFLGSSGSWGIILLGENVVGGAGNPFGGTQ